MVKFKLDINYRKYNHSKERDVIQMKKQDLINRIERLTDKQFELLIALYSQREQESVRVSQFEHPSSSQPSE